MDKEKLLTRRKFLGMLAVAIAAPIAKKVLQIPGLRVLAEASDQVEINKQPGVEFSITTGEPGAKFLAGITAGNSNGFFTTYYVDKTADLLRYANIRGRLLTINNGETIVGEPIQLFESVLPPKNAIIDSCTTFDHQNHEFVVVASILDTQTYEKSVTVQRITENGDVENPTILFADDIARYGLSCTPFANGTFMLAYADGRNGPDNIGSRFILFDKNGQIIKPETTIKDKTSHPSIIYSPIKKEAMITTTGTPSFSNPGLFFTRINDRGQIIQQGILNSVGLYDSNQVGVTMGTSHFVMEQLTGGDSHLKIYEIMGDGSVVSRVLAPGGGINMANTACVEGRKIVVATQSSFLTFPQPENDLLRVTWDPSANIYATERYGQPNLYEGNPRIAAQPSMEIVAFERSSSVDDPSELYGFSFARKYKVFLPSLER